MDFTESVLIACIPSIITGVVAYIISRKNTKFEISKLKEQSNQIIEKNRQDYVLSLKQIEIQTETKEKEFQHQIQLLKTQYESKVKEDQGLKQNDLIMSYLEKIIKSDDPMIEINKLNNINSAFNNIKNKKRKY